jgi:ribosomal protein L9
MKKKKGGETKKAELPQLQEKYQNMNRLEELENRLQDDRYIIECMKKENLNLFGEIKQKEIEIVIRNLNFFLNKILKIKSFKIKNR